MAKPIRIAMWSGPRNISTAMMRSFENRADCSVIDEPFYASYLAINGVDHPMRAEILKNQDTDWANVAGNLTRTQPDGCAVYYQKHMTHHMVPQIGRRWMADCRHAFLVRRPERVLASYARKRADVTLHDIGFAQQAELFDQARALTSAVPPVVDADVLLSNPRAVLEKLCTALCIPFDPAMLAWPPGPRASDGIWAAHWYDAVRKSTGFQAANSVAELDNPALADIAGKAQQYYDHLAQWSISAS